MSVALLVVSACSNVSTPASPASTVVLGESVDCVGQSRTEGYQLYLLTDRASSCLLTDGGVLIVNQGAVNIRYEKVPKTRAIAPAGYQSIDLVNAPEALNPGKDKRRVTLGDGTEARLFWVDGRETYVEWTTPFDKRLLLISIVIDRSVSADDLGDYIARVASAG